MKAYAIKDPSGKIMVSSIKAGERACIIQYARYDFDKYEEQGYRCVPVEITEIKSK